MQTSVKAAGNASAFMRLEEKMAGKKRPAAALERGRDPRPRDPRPERGAARSIPKENCERSRVKRGKTPR